MGKPAWQSKTFWFGLATTLLPLLDQLAGTDFIKNYPYLVSGIGAVVVILRLLTTSAISGLLQ